MKGANKRIGKVRQVKLVKNLQSNLKMPCGKKKANMATNQQNEKTEERATRIKGVEIWSAGANAGLQQTVLDQQKLK